MANIHSVITYNANLSPAQAQIKALTGQIAGLTAAFNALDKSALAAQKNLAGAFAANVGQIGGFTAQTVKAHNAVENFGKQLAANRLTMREYFREAVAGYTKQNSLMKQLAAQQVRYQQSVAVPMGGGQMMMMTPTTLAATGTSAAMAAQKFAIFNKLIDSGATSMLNWGKNTQWAGRQLMVGFTVPLMMFTALASKQFRDLDKELTRFQKVYGSDLGGAISESTTRMREEIQSLAFEISKTYGIAAKDTAALAADIAATGAEGEKLIKSVEQTTRLAVLGEVDRQEAMKATLALQSAFRLDTNQLAESINFLNAVENQTSATLEDLATAIPKVGPVVRSLGGDVQDLAVLLVAMREGGIPAAEAANALKSGLASLINPTKQASDVAKKFGVDLIGIVEANKGQLLPTIFAMKNALAGLDDFSRSRVIEQIFGKYQFARISALFDNIGRTGSQTQSVIELAAKSSTELAAVANQEIKTLTESTAVRFQRALEDLKNAIMPLGQALTETLIPIFQKIGEGIKIFAEFFQALPEPVKNFAKYGVAIAALAGPVIMLVGLFGNLIANGIKFGMMIVRLGAKMAGLKVERFELLNTEVMAAKFGVDNLTTSFTNQETAMRKLVSVMSNYEASLRRLTTANPALFIPSAIPGAKGTTPIRRQAGSTGPEFVPGTGSGDKIPALLEPGEFVVNKSATQRFAPVLMAMNRGSVKGFQAGGGTSRLAHLTPPKTVPIGDVMGVATEGSRRVLQQMLANGITEVKTFNNLVISLSKATNDALNTEKQGSGVRKSILAAELQDRQRWGLMMKAADVSFEQLQPTINGVTSAMDRLEGELINDPQLYRIVEAELIKLSNAGDVAAQRLLALSRQYGTFEYMRSDSSRPGRAAIGVSTSGVGTYKGSRLAAGSWARQSLLNVENAIDSEISRTIQSSSPSRRAQSIGQEAGRDLGMGAINGLKTGMTNAIAGFGRGPAGSTGWLMGGASPYARSGTPDWLKQRMREAERTGPGASLTRAKDLSTSGPRGAGMMNAAMGISMAVSAITMFSGATGEAANKMVMFTSALTTAMFALQAMQGMGIGGKAVGGMARLGSGVAAVGGRMTAAAGGAGMIGRLGGLLTGGGGALAAGGGAAIAATAGVAAAVAAVGAGLYLYKKSLDEARERAMAAFQDPVATVEFFGKSINSVTDTLSDIQAAHASEEFKAINDQLREAVRSDYAGLIEKIKNSVVSVGAADLGAAYTQMLVSGLSAEEALDSIKAIAAESGAAGGAAYAKAFGEGLLSSRTPEQAFERMLQTIDPQSEYNRRRVASLQAEAASITPTVGTRGYGGLTRAQMDQLGSIQEAMEVSGESFFATVESAIQLSQTAPDIVAENSEKIKQAYLDLSTAGGGLFGMGQSAQEVAFDSFKNMIGDLKDPALNKIMDSLQNATPEAQALAMELVAVGGDLNDAANAAGEFDVKLAEAAVRNTKRIAALDAELQNAKESLQEFAESSTITDKMEKGEEAIDRLTNKIDNYVESRQNQKEKLEEAFDASQDAIQNQIDALNDEKEAVQDSADAYIKSLEERAEAEDFYSNQRKSAYSALEKLASGDVFGFLQEREQMSSDAQTFAYDQAIQQIEDRRDEEVDAIDKVIEKKEELMDLNEKAHEDQMEAFDDETEKHQKELEKQLKQKSENNAKRKELILGIQEDEIQSYEDVKKAFGKKLADEYKMLVENEIRKTAAKLQAQVTAGDISVRTAEEQLIGMYNAITGAAGFQGPAAWLRGGVTTYSQLQNIMGLPSMVSGPPTSKTIDYSQPNTSNNTPSNNNGGLPPSHPDSAYTGPPSTWPDWTPGDDSVRTYKGEEYTWDGADWIKNFADGGQVYGPGTATSDSISARLSNGEYVVRASSVDKYGSAMMDAINTGKFAEGGPVGLKKSFEKWIPKNKLSFYSNWDSYGSWPGGTPRGIMMHHTAGVGPGVLEWMARNPEAGKPVVQAMVGRNAMAHILAYGGTGWGAGEGGTTGQYAAGTWSDPKYTGLKEDLQKLGSASNILWQIEVESNGTRPDFTAPMFDTIARMSAAVKEYAGWPTFAGKIINHKDWAAAAGPNRAGGQRGDTLYSLGIYESNANKIWEQGGGETTPSDTTPNRNRSNQRYMPATGGAGGNSQFGKASPIFLRAIDLPGGGGGSPKPGNGGGNNGGGGDVKFKNIPDGYTAEDAQRTLGFIKAGGWPSRLHRLAWTIAMRESGGRNIYDTGDYGIFQLNKPTYGSQPWWLSDDKIQNDAAYNSSAAYKYVSARGKNFLPWAMRVDEGGNYSWDWSYYNPRPSWADTTEKRTAAFWNSWVQKAAGGYISGAGGPLSDSIPAMLSNGEYVIRADSVRKYGKDFLDSINAGRFGGTSIALPESEMAMSAAAGGFIGMARGGMIGRSPSFKLPSQNISTVNIKENAMAATSSANTVNNSSNVKIVINGSGRNAKSIANKVMEMINNSENARNHSRSIR